MLIYYPIRPSTPPSPGAVEAHRVRVEEGRKHTWTLLSEIGHVLKSPSFMAIAIAGGLNMGVYGMWSGVLVTVLPASWGDATAGYFGLANTLSGIVGGVAAGVLTDVHAMRKRLKTCIVVAMAGAGVFFALFATALPPLSADGLGPLASSRIGLLMVCILAGFLRGSSDPLFFEVAADTAYPQSAGTAGSILTFGYVGGLCV